MKRIKPIFAYAAVHENGTKLCAKCVGPTRESVEKIKKLYTSDKFWLKAAKVYRVKISLAGKGR